MEVAMTEKKENVPEEQEKCREGAEVDDARQTEKIN